MKPVNSYKAKFAYPKLSLNVNFQDQSLAEVKASVTAIEELIDAPKDQKESPTDPTFLKRHQANIVLSELKRSLAAKRETKRNSSGAGANTGC